MTLFNRTRRSDRKTGVAAAVLMTLVGLAATPSLVAQDKFATEYAKTKAGGLLLNNMELKQTKDGQLENAVGMNGYVLIYQADNNLCLKKKEGGTNLSYRWCVNDEAKTTYQNTRKVLFVNGTLQALDGAGKVIWQSAPKKDPYAKIIISPEGKLMITNAVGAVYWSKP